MENVGVESTAYYDGQFKTGIKEGLIKHYCFLKPFSATQLSSPALYFTVHRHHVTGVIHRPT